MVTVAEELPFVAVVENEKLDTVCSNCFAVKNMLNNIDLKKCSKCLAVCYCSKKCQQEDWLFHKDECQFFADFFRPSIDVRMMSRFITRVKRGDLPVAFNGRTFDDLMDHKEEMRTDLANDCAMNKLYRNLEYFMGRENLPSWGEFRSLYGKSVINSFSIRYTGVFNSIDNLGTGLYLGIAAHNHSCRPSAEYHFNGSKIVLRARDPNAGYSKDLTISYIPNTHLRSKRQKKLRDSYYFDCDCDRCMDEEIGLLELSGKSDCCPTEGAVLPIQRKFLWYWERPLVCTNCGKKADDITLGMINDANELIADMCEKYDVLLSDAHCQAGIDDLVKTLKGAEFCLSPYNLNLLRLSELISHAAGRFNGKSTLPKKFMLTEKMVLEKYSIYKTLDKIISTLTTLKTEIHENCTNPREIAFAKFDASCQKALDIVKETYGPEHSLCKEIAQFSVMCKGYYDKTMGDDEEKEKNEEKKTEGAGDY